jgi:NADPH:quinone reductase-like Zn-dependent oxidoreductase
MRAAVIEGYGGSDKLEVRDVPDPGPPGGGQVLLRVRATSVNPLDWKIRSGKLRLVLPAKFPAVLGVDVAGEVLAIGPEVERFAPGDLVYGAVDLLRQGGAYAELALARTDALAPKPSRLSFEEAAALPLAGQTALQALRDKGELVANERVLVNGASGGVGHLAVQIGKAFGAKLTAVASARNQDFLRELGADRTIDYDEDDFTAEDDAWDIIFDAAGTRNFRDCDPSLAPNGGIYVTTAATPSAFLWTGITTAGAPFGYHKRSRIVFVRHKTEDLEILAHLVNQGRLRPVIEEVFPLGEIGKAHDLSETGHVRGKVVVRVE